MCLNANAGWNRKEQYGDSNTLFLHDLRLDTVDARLQYILTAAVQENMVDRHAPNLARGGVDVLARVGTHDTTVHPWYTRRMARVVAAEGGAVELVEVAGKEHWWWDTATPNDGGAVNDAALRAFFAACATGSVRNQQQPRAYAADETLVGVNPAAVGASTHGFRVVQQHVPYQMSRIDANVSRVPWAVATTNVRRFALDVASSTSRALVIDGASVAVDVAVSNTPVELCAGGSDATAGSAWQVCPPIDGHRRERSPETYGPMRQALESPYVIVYGTAAEAANSAGIASTLQRHAVFLANVSTCTADGVMCRAQHALQLSLEQIENANN